MLYCFFKNKKNTASKRIPPSKYINPIKNEIFEFKYNRLWVTKKIRMMAEERMNKKNLNSIILVNYYTFFILCYSILGLKYGIGEVISIMSVIVSIGLFGVSLFVSLYGYREKALAFKLSHIELDSIENKLDILLLDEKITDADLILNYKKCRDNYTDVISKTENHSNVDLLKHLVVAKKASGEMKLKYRIFHVYPYYCSMAILYIIPILGILIIVKDIWGGK
ncbi:SLATT domain-containing protein [Lysinibacillus sp. NPDC048646]|uniref:SLATT domain-containing protein n=1 Tax=Lysinibacillus sp. NPDC048646 TaxID=3390574 RepID=UPI003D04B316